MPHACLGWRSASTISSLAAQADRYSVRMTVNGDRQFPAALAAAMAVRLECIGEDGVDFEPYESFLTADETTEWFRAWTGNGELNGDDFRVFGQDGTGGYAALWLVREGRELVEQPVVFLGSEGRQALSLATWVPSCGC